MVHRYINYFELNSLIGRVLFKTPEIDRTKTNYLHLGCSNNRFDGWINADFYPEILPNFLKLSKFRGLPEWCFDFRRPMECGSEVFDGIFTEHTLEHLSPPEVAAIMNELYRTMKRGAWLRVIVPDLEKYVDFYNGRESSIGEKFKTATSAIQSLTQNHGHRSVWDFTEMKSLLLKSGFEEVKKVAFREGNDKTLLRDLEVRRWESLYIEARKT